MPRPSPSSIRPSALRRLLPLAALALGLGATLPPATAGPGWEKQLAERRQWWSLRPVRPAPPPAVKDAAWSAHPADRFLLAEMEKRGLTPAPDADAFTLCRRLHFVLTGLPPSPEETESFAAAHAADPAAAVARRVEELLASPAFGERQARHWMDLTRYADTHGSEGDPPIPEAWRYRDYLIRAFNADVPLDRLIREHIAGDLLPDPRLNEEDGVNESMIGPAHFRMVEHGFQPVDTLDEQVKTVDNQIDVLTKAFQGLTVSCARCHDHKFDAVSQEDYYALYGILASARPAQVTIDTPERQAKHKAELTDLKRRMRAPLAAAWLAEAEKLPGRLLAQTQRARELAEREARERALAGELAELERAARAEALKRRALTQTSAATRAGTVPFPAATVDVPERPRPVAQWSFEGDARDSLGQLHGSLAGGAEIANGRLKLNGRDAAFVSVPLTVSIREKTLEAWVLLSTPDQGGGGVVTLEKEGGAVFDSIVYAEHEARRWMAGSEYGRRSASFQGEAEDGAALTHVACVYTADGGIQFYRNGRPYGTGYKTGGPLEFPAGASRVLLGQRHTGGGRAFLRGEIDEARLYDRALTAEEIAASFQAGPENVGEAEWLATLTDEQLRRRAALRRALEDARREIDRLKNADPSTLAWDAALAAAEKDPLHPLRPWAVLGAAGEEGFPEKAAALQAELEAKREAARRENAARFKVAWDLSSPEAGWFPHGPGPVKTNGADFAILFDDSRKAGLRLPPAGWITHSLSTKHNGVLTSPRFRIETDSISIRATGGGGARVRLIVDHYPLGGNATYPEATLGENGSRWIHFDTAYRKGSWAYLEFAAAGDQTFRNGGARPSWFSVEKVVFHDDKEPPAEEGAAVFAWRVRDRAPENPQTLARAMAEALKTAVAAWRDGAVTEEQRALLEFFLSKNLLLSPPDGVPELAEPLARYRELEADIPRTRQAPGLLEATGVDAPLFTRGDHRKPEAEIPRRYLEVLGGAPANGRLSGRLELAEAIAGEQNPLTPRVMANRIWQQVFGRGIVATPDDFGKMGEKPTHPELLEFLAAKLREDGWSLKKTLTFLLTTRAFRLSSEPPPGAAERDAANDFLSHARVRRLEAEAIHDSLLSASGQLAPPPRENRMPENSAGRPRAVYLPVKRTEPNPFLGVFDWPVPFTTTGRRSETTVPAQSLALLNDPFTRDCAARAADRELAGHPEATAKERIDRLFRRVLGRPPTAFETERGLAFLEMDAGARTNSPEPWREFVHSLFNLKEFIYIR